MCAGPVTVEGPAHMLHDHMCTGSEARGEGSKAP